MVDNMTPYEALLAAVDKAGSLAALARICGVSTTAVWKWVQSSKRMPAEYVLRAEAATGVSRHALRPDIYPFEMAGASAPRWSGIDQSAATRVNEVDARARRVAFNCSRISQRGAA